MATVISVALQKGGTGKSTTAQTIASILGFRGKKVLLIDMDSQGNVTYASGTDTPQKSIVNILERKCTVNEALIRCKYYELLAADSYLANVEITENIEPTLLKNTINPVIGNYDFIIIDTPPALGNLSFNSLVASDYVLIPVEARPFALQGLGALYDTISSIQKKINPTLEIAGILMTKFNDRIILNRDIREMIGDFAKRKEITMFNTVIRESIAIAEAQTVRKPLIDYAPKNNSNIDYEAFVDELMEKIGAWLHGKGIF